MTQYSQRPDAFSHYTNNQAQVKYSQARRSPPPVPLAERALLDLRRPNSKSAFSPPISKRSRGNSETKAGRSQPLDQYLGQGVYQPNAGNSASTSRTTTTLPGPPRLPAVATSQKKVWAKVSGTVSYSSLQT